MQNIELQPEAAGRRLQVLRGGLGTSGVAGVDERANTVRLGDQLVQQLQALRPQLDVQKADARDIATRSVHAGYESRLDRIETCREDDRNRRGCGLRCSCREAV